MRNDYHPNMNMTSKFEYELDTSEEKNKNEETFKSVQNSYPNSYPNSYECDSNIFSYNLDLKYPLEEENEPYMYYTSYSVNYKELADYYDSLD